MKKLFKAISFCGLATFALSANASYTTVFATVNVKSACEKNAEQNTINDIGIGKTGNGFSSCNIFSYENDQYVQISPVVAKFNQGSSTPEVNSDYVGNADLDGDNWRFSDQNDTNWNFEDGNTSAAATTSGSWRYDDSSGIHIRYWAIKAGAQEYNLFWKVSNNDWTNHCSQSTFNLACLTAALTTDNGVWHSPSNGNNQAQLSNITFFNSKDPVNDTTRIPEPGSLLMLGLGLAVLARSRQKQL